MQKYIRTFRKHYQLGEQDIVLCEVCGAVAVDIHHIIPRSQQGSDEVDNLIALCRQHHMQAHNLQEPYLSVSELQNIKQMKIVS